MEFDDNEPSQLRRQAFQQALLTNASNIFNAPNFAASYGQPQVRISLDTCSALLEHASTSIGVDRQGKYKGRFVVQKLDGILEGIEEQLGIRIGLARKFGY